MQRTCNSPVGNHRQSRRLAQTALSRQQQECPIAHTSFSAPASSFQPLVPHHRPKGRVKAPQNLHRFQHRRRQWVRTVMKMPSTHPNAQVEAARSDDDGPSRNKSFSLEKWIKRPPPENCNGDQHRKLRVPTMFNNFAHRKLLHRRIPLRNVNGYFSGENTRLYRWEGPKPPDWLVKINTPVPRRVPPTREVESRAEGW